MPEDSRRFRSQLVVRICHQDGTPVGQNDGLPYNELLSDTGNLTMEGAVAHHYELQGIAGKAIARMSKGGGGGDGDAEQRLMGAPGEPEYAGFMKAAMKGRPDLEAELGE